MSVLPVTVRGMALSIGMVTIDCTDPQSLAVADPKGDEFCVGNHHG